jgi:DNA modification methylase
MAGGAVCFHAGDGLGGSLGGAGGGWVRRTTTINNLLTRPVLLYRRLVNLGMEIRTDLYLGDCKTELARIADNSVDLIVTSPPYADQRKGTYGGIHPDEYVDWFLPTSKELLRALKPSGTFILNIKEKVVEVLLRRNLVAIVANK